MAAGGRARGLGVGAVGLVATWVLVAPVVVLVLSALSRSWFFPDPLPRRLSLGHAAAVLDAPGTWAALRDGVLLSTVVTAIAVVAAWPAARVLSRPGLRGRGLVFGVLFLPSLLPAVGLAMGIDVALLRVGLAGRFTGVVLAHLVPTLPYAVGVLTAVFVAHDDGAERQAATLGASPWQRWNLVTLPLVRPGLAVAAGLAFLVSWSQYLLTLLVGSGRVVTVNMALFTALSGGNPTTIATLALLVAAPAVVVLAAVGHALPTWGRDR